MAPMNVIIVLHSLFAPGESNSVTGGEQTMSSNTNNGGKVKVPEAKPALNNMKTEIANELGLANYQNMDKGNLTARQNGYVGGYMTKKLVDMAEQQMAGKSF